MAITDLQTTQQNVLDMIGNCLHGTHQDDDGTETDVTAADIKGVLSAPLYDGRIHFNLGMNWTTGSGAVDGTPLLIFSDGASAVPGLTLASEQQGIRWNNHATPDPIGTQFVVPEDMDVTQASTLKLLAFKVGATVGDAVTWTVTAFSVGDGDLATADADFGGASSAMTGDSATLTCQLETLALAADTMSEGDVVNITVQPTDGTLGTDDVVLIGCYLDYKKKIA